MRFTRAIAIVLIPILLAACANKEEQGTAVGAVAGGLLGSAMGRGNGKIAGALVGAVAGGIVGSAIGRSMDQQDRMLAQRAELDAFERGRQGRPVAWRNPENGRYGEVIRASLPPAVAPIAATTPTRFISTVSPRRCAARPAAIPTAPGAMSADRPGRWRDGLTAGARRRAPVCVGHIGMSGPLLPPERQPDTPAAPAATLLPRPQVGLVTLIRHPYSRR